MFCISKIITHHPHLMFCISNNKRGVYVDRYLHYLKLSSPISFIFSKHPNLLNETCSIISLCYVFRIKYSSFFPLNFLNTFLKTILASYIACINTFHFSLFLNLLDFHFPKPCYRKGKFNMLNMIITHYSHTQIPATTSTNTMVHN